ncbi:ABC transporter ATP-binding protein [Foetidibacter luteolus]|uniref:ABC transporter ATP-binding protein n=1 Tax=Foetidibacter luteolus TaxID=2608880 RepID=UPI00129B326B|nr:ABC transporter ATP-binding protein [Foetidibacter luteolus]
MPPPLLTIQNLSVGFTGSNGTTNALHDITIEVNRGELVAIVGESGSGKSVTSLSILQLLPTPPAVYSSGKILFTDNDSTTDLLKASPAEIREVRGNKIAMIFQEPMTSLNPVYTCGNQVTEAILAHKNLPAEEARQQALELFKKVQLPYPELIYNKYPHEISGGQKQRVMIAMAMSCQPSLLICDEPTTALDVTVQQNILELIKQLQLENNMGVIFISHDLGVIANIADKVVVMYKGRIVEQGMAGQVFKHAAHPYTKALLACRPALYDKHERLPVVKDFLPEENTAPATPAKAAEIKPVVHHTFRQPLLSVHNLRVWYPAEKNFFGKPLSYIKAVDDISFEVYSGETIGLVGESGCGKTTTGRAIAGLLQPTGGNIVFDGEDLVTAGKAVWKKIRKDIQIIFQDPYSSLNPRKTVGEAIAEPLKVHNLYASAAQRREYVMALLQKVSLLPEHYKRYPHEFSGGQRQRLVIARALALQPRFIICDESVSALDVSVQAQVLNLLNDLKKELGFTAIFISHDLSVVKYISNRIIVMNKGRIEEQGNAEDIYYRPANAYTQKLIAAIPAMPY